MTNFKEVSDKVSKPEFDIIAKIAERAIKQYAENGINLDRITLEMDLVAVHGHCCPLDLSKFLKFDDFNFAHDISGISRHLDRKNIELRDCFLPRAAI